MNINFTTADSPEVQKVEFVDKADEYRQKRFKKSDVLVFIVCIIGAFLIWCYVNYVDDPIIQKEVTVDIVLVNGSLNEYIVPNKMKISVYGEESVINSISDNTITVYVERSKITDYDTTVDYAIEYPQGVHSHTKSVEIKLMTNKK
ncbi:MAG: hypothetical protein J6S23_02080 [Clostridia bacterium]|nr:hypothetical protein [Clostridia bacterium]